jgi:hypothetical protein
MRAYIGAARRVLVWASSQVPLLGTTGSRHFLLLLRSNRSSKMKISTQMAGTAGEYFVAAELSRRGHIASISLKNTCGVDVLVTNDLASHSVTIQCKTTRSNRRYWMLDKKCEKFFSDNHFYVFVVLGEPLHRPEFHVVPSKFVAEYTTERHREYHLKPKLDGTPRQDNSLRIFTDEEKKFLEKWELLGL